MPQPWQNMTNPALGEPIMPPPGLRPQRRPQVKRELKRFHDDFEASLVETRDVPDPDLVDTVYVMAWRNDKAIIVRDGGPDELWELPVVRLDARVLQPGEDASTDAAANRKALDKHIKTALRERWGIRLKDWDQFMRLELTATPENRDYASGSLRYRLVLCATVSDTDDLPPDGSWARRSIITRDFNQFLRTRYPELDDVLTGAHDWYLLQAAQRA